MLSKKKAFTVIVIIIAVIVILTGCAVAKKSASLKHRPTEQQIKQIQLFNETSEQMYQSLKKGNVMDARGKLIQMNSQVTRLSFDGITSAEGMNALTDTLAEAARTFSAVKFSQSQAETAAAKVRLAADALSHPNHPLWQQYNNLIQKDLNEIEKTVKSGKSREAQQAMEQLNQHYAVIKPSLRISGPAEDVEKMDSLMVFLQGQLGAKMLQTKIIEDGLNSYREAVNGIFYQKTMLRHSWSSATILTQHICP